MNSVMFTYQRTKEDVINQQVWQTFFRNRVMTVFTVMFPVLGVVFFINSIMSEFDPIVYFAIAYLVFYPLINYGMIRLRINRTFKNPELKFDTTTFDYREDGVNITSEQGELLLEWERVTAVYQTKGYFYIYVDKRTSILINKSILSDLQIEDVIALFQAKTGPGVCKFK